MNRAEKFIESEFGKGTQISINVPTKAFADLLEQFHKECMPTDDEALDLLHGSILHESDAYNEEIKKRFIVGVRVCRDFVREEKKETMDKKRHVCSGCKFNELECFEQPCVNCWDGCIWSCWQPKEEKKMVGGNFVLEDKLSGRVFFQPDLNGNFEIEQI